MSNEKETKVSALDAKAKALANEEDEDTKIAKLLKNMPKWRFYSLAVLTVIWTVFQLYIKLVKPLDPWFQLPLHMCLALVVVWLYNPMVEKSKSHNKLWWIYDIFLIASSCFICWFFLSHAEQLNYRIFNVDVMTTTEVIVAVLLVINVMEAVRRVVSMSLFWVICFFLAYAWFGQYIPGLFRFSGISFPKLMEVLMYGENGIFGSPLVTSLGTLFYFLVFGTFFSNCGGGGVLIDGGMKLSDKTVGGPAKAAVISSGLLGMVSGSAIANVSTTGVLTIPLMKKTGYKPEFAGAVEAAASTGGQIMPPIMGAAAFLMAEYMNIPYAKVAVKAILPAVLYFTGIFIAVHLEAKKLGLKGMPKSEMVSWGELAKRAYLIIPLALLIFLVSSGSRTMQFSAAVSILAAIVVGFLNKEERLTFGKIVEALEAGAKGAITVAVACAMAGMIAGCITVTGLASILINAIVQMAGDATMIGLLLTMICCIILGMGVPTTANYCIMASTCAPILVQMGFPLVAAHFFVFYFGIVADITPPVALAAYAGAAIAKANPMKTGINATKLAIAAFIVPYIFAYSPALLFENISGWWEVAQICVSALLGIFAIAASLNGFLYKKIHPVLRIVLAVGGLGMMIPGTLTDVVGLVLVAAVVAYQKISAKKHGGPVVTA